MEWPLSVSRRAKHNSPELHFSALAETRQNSRSTTRTKTRTKTDWLTEHSEPVVKPRFIMFRRGEVYYSEDTVTRNNTACARKTKAKLLRF